jgi:hypothetical protein
MEMQNSELTNTDNIISLAPRSDNNGNSQKIYENRLKAALKKKGIKNIALTGIYGSGKSTILNTFKAAHAEDWKFADISLSAFDTKDKEDLDAEDLQLIERSILQQLFYSVDHDVIPLSRFKRIVKTSEESKWKLFSLIATAFISYFIVFSTNDKLLSIIPDWEWLPFVALVLLLISFLMLLYKILGYALSLKEIKFKLHDAEFDIRDEEDKSILNDHIDEIIYFFQETGKNVVIIEDLDRFNNTTIFIRLRELNALINGACNHQIVFVYAIKDDMFTDTERSKFFEYIIPVIPIINPTNAYDTIQKDYKHIVEGVDRRFLRNTCLYFDDMRLLINILNEYQDYTSHLAGLQLDKNQLFAMIVYKNYYPNEFAKLNSNQGQIYEIFNDKKSQIIESKVNIISRRIDNLNKKKEKVLKECLLSISELNAVYSHFLNTLLREKNPTVSAIKVNNESVTIGTYDETILLELGKMQNQNIEFEIQYGHYKRFMPSEISFMNVESLTSSDFNYVERLEAIKNKQPERLGGIANEINSLRKKISVIKNEPIKELLQNEEVLDIPEQLIFFIMNGYIDENYPDYISLFFETSISRYDKDYAMVVNGRQIPKFELELKNHSELLTNYLLEDEMSTDSVLNISMLSYLSQINSFKEYKQNFLSKMCDKSDISVEFLTLLFDKDVDFFDSFIPLLIKYDDTVFDEILEQEDSEQTISNYSRIIKYSGSALKNDSYLAEKLSNFLSKRVDYIDYVKDSLEHGKASFQDFSLKIKPEFKHLEASDSGLFNWLGGQGFFSIELDIIKDTLMCNLLLSLDEIERRLKNAPLTTICNSGINYLVDSFWQNTDSYVHLLTTYLEDKKQLHEDEEIFIRLLNQDDLSEENKEKLLVVVATEVADINQVEEELHNKLLEHNVIKSSWENVSKYFEAKDCELTESLINFIDINAHLLNVSRTKYIQATSSNEELQKKLEIELVKSNNLSDTSYQNIVKTLIIKWNRIDFTGLNESKVLTLIANNKLSLTKENLEYITAYDMSNVRKAYLEHYILLIADGELTEFLDTADYVTIISSRTLNKARKQKFIEENMSKIIEIVSTSSKTIIDIFDNKRLPAELYNKIKDMGNEDYIQYLFMGQFNYMSSDEVLNLLPLMGEPFNELNKDSKTKFNLNSKNKKLLDALYERKIIVVVKEINKIIGNSYYESRLRKDL